MGDTGLATHHDQASEESTELSLSLFHTLGCDPRTKTVPDDQNILRFRTLINQPSDGR